VPQINFRRNAPASVFNKYSGVNALAQRGEAPAEPKAKPRRGEVSLFCTLVHAPR